MVKKKDSIVTRPHVHFIKSNGYVDFRLSGEDFKIIYLALRHGVVDSEFVERFKSLVDLFEGIYSRI